VRRSPFDALAFAIGPAIRYYISTFDEAWQRNLLRNTERDDMRRTGSTTIGDSNLAPRPSRVRVSLELRARFGGPFLRSTLLTPNCDKHPKSVIGLQPPTSYTGRGRDVGVAKWRMLSRTYNRVIQCTEASTPAGIEALYAGLPAVVRRQVIVDLQERSSAQHYDSASGYAYFFIRHGTRLVVWSWCCIASSNEAARLQSSLDSLIDPLNEETASGLFERATGRSVNEPLPSYSY
jgi:hypothetical protein